jgi:hypothetical protein
VVFNVSGSNYNFFNSITEIRDDAFDGYEWGPMAMPGDNVATTAARGLRQLRRALNSMVLATIFTHEYFFHDPTNIMPEMWREILSQLTSGIAEYIPEYKSLDFASKYVRAKNNIRITNLQDGESTITISYSGSNDMDTKCYLFTGQGDEIIFEFIVLPQASGNQTVIVAK